ncbi:MAG: four helix bundle protein [Patescibacteria group bacterium]|nr:four helix bundle protein [Patescibacteria group bacterium]
MANQMRRAAVSVTSNIAEEFNREHSKEKVQFYAMARGSVGEVQSQLHVARDASFLSQSDFHTMYDQSVHVHKLINGLIKSSKRV